MKIKIAFYRYNKKIVNAGISLWTWLFNPFTPAYSHVEIGICVDNEWTYFSSTLRDGAKGTRWIASKKLFKHPERWDVYNAEVPSVKNITLRADSILNLPYDWVGIFGFAMPFGLLNIKGKWYCAEACYFALTGIWKRRISPRRFYSFTKKTLKISIGVT